MKECNKEARREILKYMLSDLWVKYQATELWNLKIVKPSTHRGNPQIPSPKLTMLGPMQAINRQRKLDTYRVNHGFLIASRVMPKSLHSHMHRALVCVKHLLGLCEVT